MDSNPKIILLFSGKRKSGKDFLTDALYSRLNSANSVIIKISGPIKSHWAECNNLPLEDLLSSNSFKEQYRQEMIKWSEELRKKDPGIFCRQAIEMYRANEKPVWIISDCRRKTDISWFKQTYSPDIVKTIRINASEKTRQNRNWVFSPGVDDVMSECDLDDFGEWDWVFDNNEDADALTTFLTDIVDFIHKMVEES